MIKVFEMFAGVGGASFALKKAGIPHECVGYSEIDKNAIEIFKLNHGEIKNYGDCSKINPRDLPDFDLLTAGFPCQPFSINTNKNARGKTHKDYNLFEDIIKILAYKKPKHVIIENVKGILGEKSKWVYDSLCKSLSDLGYDYKTQICNSKDYGTPQNRERVFFIGKLGKFEEGEFEFPEKEELKLSIINILEKDAVRREPIIKNYVLKKQSNIDEYGKISRFDAVLKNRVDKNKSNVMFEILDAPSNVVSRQSDRIYKPTYAPCLTATGRDYLFYVNDEVIVLTPKECARVMGYFKDEINLGNLTDSQKHKLLGNSWDINLTSKIMKNLYDTIEIVKKPKLDKKVIQLKKEINYNIGIVDLKKEIKTICDLDIKDKYKLTLIKQEVFCP